MFAVLSSISQGSAISTVYRPIGRNAKAPPASPNGVAAGEAVYAASNCKHLFVPGEHRNPAYLSIGVTSSSGTGQCEASGEVIPGVLRGFIQDPANELPRIPIPRTSVNKDKDTKGRGSPASALTSWV